MEKQIWMMTTATTMIIVMVCNVDDINDDDATLLIVLIFYEELKDKYVDADLQGVAADNDDAPAVAGNNR